MDKQTVEVLRELHKQLRHVESLNDPDRELLKKLQADLQALLAESDKESPPEYESLVERLRDAGQRFEASHPHLTDLINTLSNLGL